MQLRYSQLRPNRMVQNRFIRLCKFLSVNTDKFEVVTLIIAANEPDGRRGWAELTGDAFDALVRAVANAMNDHLKFI